MAKTKNIKFGDGNTERDGVNAHASSGVITNPNMDKELKRLGIDKKHIQEKWKYTSPNPNVYKV
tara:strand:+ start:1305 stop:1496 length:192 start_codon:yes stop_codon:yes gene_type:complete